MLALVAGLPACGGGGSDDTSAPGAGGSAVASSALRRDMRPEAVSARQLIDDGRADLARPIVEAVAGDLGVEGPLLWARLTFLERDEATWLAFVEDARAIDPSDPRPYATAAEIYAALGRTEAARDELKRGVEAAGGLTPELQRAQGIAAIVLPGGGKVGLERLMAAVRSDPELPFTDRALGQAYLLSAKRAMAEDARELAMERIQLSLKHDPLDIDARHFYGQVLISQHDFVGGLDLLEELYSEGEPIGAELASKHWSAGFYAQVRQERGAARKHYLRARALGHQLEVGGTAMQFLGEEWDAAFERGDAAARLGDETKLRASIAEMVGLKGGDAMGVKREIASVFLSRAQVALTQGDLPGAASLLGAAVQTDRDVPGGSDTSRAIYMAKAVDAIERNEPIVAAAFAEEATVAQPDSALAWHLFGDLNYATGDYEVAADALHKAMALAKAGDEPLGIDVALRLAESQHLADQVPAAIATLEQCIRSARPEDAAKRDEAERHLRLLRN